MLLLYFIVLLIVVNLIVSNAKENNGEEAGFTETRDFGCSTISEVIKIAVLFQRRYDKALDEEISTTDKLFTFDRDFGVCSKVSGLIRNGEQLSILRKLNQLSFDFSGVKVHVPMSRSECFHILNEEISLTARSRKSHFDLSTNFILWPFEIRPENNTHAHNHTCLSLSLDFRFNLIRKLLLMNETLFHAKKLRINQEIMLVFKFICGKNGQDEILWSVWEVYAILDGEVDNSKNDNFLELNEVFFMSSDSLQRCEKEFCMKNVTTLLQRRSNFQHTLIRAVAPYFKDIKIEVDWEHDSSNGEIKFIGGMAINILWDLQTLLNFSLQVIPGDFFVTGPQPAANLSGYKPVTQDLLKFKQIEIMIGHTTPTTSRLKSVDILFPSSHNRLWAYVHQPNINYVRDVFTYPLQPKLWIAIVITWTILLIATNICVKILTNFCHLNDPFSSEVTFWSVALIAQKGPDLPPSSHHLRATFFLTIFLTSVCFYAYSAAVVGILSREEIPIPDLPSLFLSNLPIHAAIESSNIAEIVKGLQSEGRIKSARNPFLRTPKGVAKLFRKPCSFISYDHLFHMERQLEGITEVEYCSKIDAFPLVKTTIATSMTMPKRSSLREIFNHKLLLLSERGLLFRYQKIFHRQGGVQCPKSEIPSKFPLAVDDLFTAFLICLFGLILSPVILFLEKIATKYTTTPTPTKINETHNLHFLHPVPISKNCAK